MKENISPAKVAVSYGVVFGVIMILEFVIAYTLNVDPITYPWYGVTTQLLNFLVLPLLFILLACSQFKKLNMGYGSFGQCLKAGVTVMVIASALASIFTALFYIIFPEAKAKILEMTKEITVKQSPNVPAEQLKMSMEWVELSMEPYINIPFTILMFTVIGLIYSLIIAAIIKKDNPGEQYN